MEGKKRASSFYITGETGKSSWMNGWLIGFVGVEKETEKEIHIHPSEAPNPERWDKFAEELGYRRVKPS